MLRAILCVAFCLMGVPDIWARETTSTRFTVQAFGLKVGELHLTGSTTARTYAANARFATTTVIDTVKNLSFAIASTGHRDGAKFRPAFYNEHIRIGRKDGTVRMKYRNAIPTVTGSRPDQPDVIPPDISLRVNTVDPMTGLFIVMRDQPDTGVCKVDQAMFDGTRRTRIVLRNATPVNEGLVCTGWLERLAGYPPDQITNFPSSALKVTYVSGSDGLMRVHSAQMRSMFGLVVLTRR